MRLFVAATLSDTLTRSITDTMHALKKQGVRGNFVPAKNLHLTLAFLGETEDPAAVKKALETVKIKPFRLSLSEMGMFGDLLWVGAKGNQGMSGAARAVRDALDAAGIPYDRQKFVPHITLVRKAAGAWKQVPAPRGDMMVSRISLMKSSTRDGKTVYTEIFSV